MRYQSDVQQKKLHSNSEHSKPEVKHTTSSHYEIIEKHKTNIKCNGDGQEKQRVHTYSQTHYIHDAVPKNRHIGTLKRNAWLNDLVEKSMHGMISWPLK